MTLSTYLQHQVSALIDGVARESAKADTSADGVHDLRVAIRRLSECLRVFESVFPEGAADHVRQAIRLAMKQAGAVRNHDIAADLMSKASLAVPLETVAGREQAAQKLAAVLVQWNSSSAPRSWLEKLRG